jgi:hypothetical protein
VRLDGQPDEGPVCNADASWETVVTELGVEECLALFARPGEMLRSQASEGLANAFNVQVRRALGDRRNVGRVQRNLASRTDEESGELVLDGPLRTTPSRLKDWIVFDEVRDMMERLAIHPAIMSFRYIRKSPDRLITEMTERTEKLTFQCFSGPVNQ